MAKPKTPHKRAAIRHDTPELKRAVVNAILADIAGGMRATDALKKNHVNWTSWGKWRKLYAADVPKTPGRRMQTPSRHDTSPAPLSPPASIAKQPTYFELQTENKYLRDELGRRLLAEFISKAPKS